MQYEIYIYSLMLFGMRFRLPADKERVFIVYPCDCRELMTFKLNKRSHGLVFIFSIHAL